MSAKYIGGYLGLDLQNDFEFPHNDGVLLNTGRNALEFILRTIPKVSKVYLPYYTCHTVMQPIHVLGLTYEYYHINDLLEIKSDIDLKPDEYIIYTNYFGLKDDYVKYLYQCYRHSLIVDNAQAFFSSEKLCKKTFFTPHKFVGISNGSIAYSDEEINLDDYEVDIACYRTGHLFVRFDLLPISGYNEYKTNMRQSRNQPIRKMSNLTYSLLRNIDFNRIRDIRIRNVNYLQEALERSNRLELSVKDIPLLAYPYRTKNLDLRKKLIENNIFCPKFWPNVQEWCASEDLEYKLVDEIIPLPIDQRYGIDDMNIIIDTIRKYE